MSESSPDQKTSKKSKIFMISFFSLTFILLLWNFTYGPSSSEWQYADLLNFVENAEMICETNVGVPSNYYSGAITIQKSIPPSLFLGSYLTDEQQKDIEEKLEKRLRELPCWTEFAIGTGRTP